MSLSKLFIQYQALLSLTLLEEQVPTLLINPHIPGDIAFRYIESIKSNPLYLPVHPGKSPKQRPPSKVLVCDINPDMLEVGKQRAIERGYTEDGGTSFFE